MTVKTLVLKTVPGVTQMVLTQMVDCAGCTDDKPEVGGKMVSHSVGEMDDTPAKTVTVDSLVTVKVDVTTWLSVCCSLNASKAGAGLTIMATLVPFFFMEKKVVLVQIQKSRGWSGTDAVPGRTQGRYLPRYLCRYSST